MLAEQRVSVLNAPIQTFAEEGDRRRLSATAATAVLRLCQAWGVSNAEASALIGVSESTWDRIKSGRWDGVFSQDQLTRASALIGIYKGLRELQELMQLVKDKRLQPVPSTCLPFGKAFTALLALEEGKAVGRQILTPEGAC